MGTRGIILAIVVAAFGLMQPAVRANLVRNGDFTQAADGKPADWTAVDSGQKVTTEKPADRAGALRVDVLKDAGKNLGEIRQTIKVQKGQKYRVTAELKSTKTGAAMVMVKTRAPRKELERIAVGTSTEQWATVTKDFDSGDAVEVQVLCRYVQKAESVGATSWFTNVVLVPLDAAGQPLATPAPATAPAAAPAATRRARPAAATAPVLAAPGTDQYVAPDGAGDRSGRDLPNARPASGLQAAIVAAGPGNTVFIGSGTYERCSLQFASGGAGPTALKTIAGKDTGGGLPLFRGTFDKTKPEKSGTILLSVAEGVSHIVIRDLKVEAHRGAIKLAGRHANVRIENVDVTETRDAFWLAGGANAGQPETGSHDLLVKDCDVRFFTKRAARVVTGAYRVQFVNCHADAGGKEWAVENFPIGFQVGEKGTPGIGEHDITFTDCTAANSYQGPENGAKGYWNADGFSVEGNVRDITWVRCGAFNCTDGGWDVKAFKPRWVDCIAVGNKRNFRIWSQPGPGAATLENCLSAFATDRGNRNNHAGFWILSGGQVTLTRCTAWGDPRSLQVEEHAGEPPKPTTVILDRCLISPADGGTALAVGAAAELKDSGSIIRKDAAGPAVKLRNPAATWQGGDASFDSVSHPDAGYHYAKPAAAQ